MNGLVGDALRNAVADAGFRAVLETRPTAEAVAQVDCVIAESSSRDSNTMYSLGIASALGHPTVLISRSLESLPSHALTGSAETNQGGQSAQARSDCG